MFTHSEVARYLKINGLGGDPVRHSAGLDVPGYF